MRTSEHCLRVTKNAGEDSFHGSVPVTITLPVSLAARISAIWFPPLCLEIGIKHLFDFLLKSSLMTGEILRGDNLYVIDVALERFSLVIGAEDVIIAIFVFGYTNND